MSLLHIVAIACLIVSFVFAAVKRQWDSAILWAVWSAAILYVLSGVVL